jgi:hypothetical protein
LKKRAKLSKEFSDKRKAVAKSYYDAHNCNKHDLLAKLVDKIVSFGFHATYFLADAWFGTKQNIRLAIKQDLIAIFMMKRGKAKYRYQGVAYTAKGLYRKFRNEMIKVKEKSFHACAINAEYNISADPKKPK